MEKNGEIREDLTPPETPKCGCGKTACTDSTKTAQEVVLESHLTKRAADKATEQLKSN